MTSNNDPSITAADGHLSYERLQELLLQQNLSALKQGIREVIIPNVDEEDIEGDLLIFTAKSMIHKEEVIQGNRIAIFGSLGYGTLNACDWYHEQIEHQLYNANNEL